MMSISMHIALVVLTTVASPDVKARELQSVVRTADTIIRARDVHPVVWQDAREVALEDIEKWYGALPAPRRQVYDRIRDAVRGTTVFDRPVTFFMRVRSAKVQPSGEVVLYGTAAVRREDVADYYTRDQKKQIAEMKLAIRDKQFRHAKDMKKMTDNTPIKLELIQRHQEAIDEIGERVRRLRKRFNPAAEERMVAGETAAVRVMVPKTLAKTIPVSKLPMLSSVELVMRVSEFYIRAPLAEFDRPAAVGALVGRAQSIGTIRYRSPAEQSKTKKIQTPKSQSQPQPSGSP